MKTPEQLLAEAIESTKKAKKDDEIISKLLKIKDEYQKKGDAAGGDWISKKMGHLSVLMYNLGEMVSKAQLQSNSAYIYRKWKKSFEFNKIKMYIKTISEADKRADLEIAEQMEQEIMTQYKADYLKTTYDDMRRIYETMRSRLSYLKFEAQSSNETRQI